MCSIPPMNTQDKLTPAEQRAFDLGFEVAFQLLVGPLPEDLAKQRAELLERLTTSESLDHG